MDDVYVSVCVRGNRPWSSDPCYIVCRLPYGTLTMAVVLWSQVENDDSLEFTSPRHPHDITSSAILFYTATSLNASN